MAGFNSITGDESIMFADNCSFDGTDRGGKMTTDGQVWIGSTVAPHVRTGLPTGQAAFSASVMQANYGNGTLNFENRTWSTPYVVDSNATVGQRGTFTTIQAAINACLADGNASLTQPGYIHIRGKGQAAPYIENLVFPANATFYLEGDTPIANGAQIINVVIQGQHTITALGGVYASNIYFNSNSGSVPAFTIANTTLAATFYNCALSFSNTGGGVSIQNCILTIGGTQSGGTLTAFDCTLNAMTISGGTQTFIRCDNPQFTFSGTAAPVCVDCRVPANGSSWIGTTSGTPAYLGGTFAPTFAYTGNLLAGAFSEYTGITAGDFFGANITQRKNRQIQGNCLIQRKVSGSATVDNTDYYIGVTSTASAFTMTLPTTANTVQRPYRGQVFIFKDESGAAGTNNITIAANGGTINGAASIAISTNYGTATVAYDGTNYFTI